MTPHDWIGPKILNFRLTAWKCKRCGAARIVDPELDGGTTYNYDDQDCDIVMISKIMLR